MVFIEEFSVEDIIFILCGLQECYEVYYKIEILDEVLVVVVELSNCYIVDCQLLDKVIDLIDESVVCLCLEFDSVFEEVDEWECKVC